MRRGLLRGPGDGRRGHGRYLNCLEGALLDPTTNELRLKRAIGGVVGYQVKAADWVRVNRTKGEDTRLNFSAKHYIN